MYNMLHFLNTLNTIQLQIYYDFRASFQENKNSRHKNVINIPDSWHGGNNNKNYFHAEKLKKDENWSLWIVYDKRFLLIPKPWITTITILTSSLNSGPQGRRIDNLKNQAEIWRVLAHNFDIFSTLNATGSCCAGKYYTSYYSLYSY